MKTKDGAYHKQWKWIRIYCSFAIAASLKFIDLTRKLQTCKYRLLDPNTNDQETDIQTNPLLFAYVASDDKMSVV